MSGDKTAGQWVGSIVGAVVGYVASGFNPVGAIQGAAIGAGLGGIVDPPKGPSVRGPRLQDSTVQGVQYGTPLLRGHGRFASVGTVIYLENNRLKETISKKKQGGKGGGGGSSTVTTYTYSATFGIALADVPADGIKAIGKIWIGSDLVYNGESSNLETIVASNKSTVGTAFGLDLPISGGGSTISGNNGVKFKIYPGTDDQLPDARIEAELGVGNAPAFRGTCYIMLYDLPLKKYGNSLLGAQVKVELIVGDIVPTGLVLLSTKYADGPSTSSVGITGCTSPLNSDGSSWVLTKNLEEQKMVLNKILPYGAIIKPRIGPISTYGDAIDGYTDISSWASTKSGKIFCNGQEFSFPIVGNAFRYINKIDDTFVLFHQEFSGGLSARIYSYTSEILSFADQIPDYYVLALFDESTIVGIEDDGLTVTTFSTSNLTVLDTFSLPSVWPTSGDITVLTSQRTWCCVDSGVFYVYSSSSAELLIIDIESQTEINRIDVAGIYYNAARGGCISVRYGILSIFENGLNAATPSRVYHLHLNGFSESGVPLSSVVQAELTRSELIDASDINVTDLSSDIVRGYRLAGVQQVRGCIGPLQAAWPFDLIADGYQIKAVRRGNSSIRTITSDDLDAKKQGDQSGVQLKQSREMDSQLPSKILLKYIDSNREHEINEQPSVERKSSGSVQVQEVDLPIVFSPDEAAATANVMFNMAWTERYDYQHTLSPADRKSVV